MTPISIDELIYGPATQLRWPFTYNYKCSHRRSGWHSAEFDFRFCVGASNCPYRASDTQNPCSTVVDRLLREYPADELIDSALCRAFRSSAGSLKSSGSIPRSESALRRNRQLDTGTERQTTAKCIAFIGSERLAT